MLKSMSLTLTEPNRTSNFGKDFFYSHLSFTAAYSLKSEKIGLLILLNSEAASPTVFILASVSFWPLLIIESVARVSQHVLFTHDLLVKQV